jgi:undecaprenyl-diphosphatase
MTPHSKKKIALFAALLTLAGLALSEPIETVETEPHRITRSQAVLLGVTEGLTEYLPVSSTGHLILVAEAMGLGGFEKDAEGELVQGPLGPIMKPNPAINSFNIVIQIGAIIAVIGIYFKRILQMLSGLMGKDPVGRKLLINLLVAFTPAVILGLLFDDLIEQYLFSPLTVALALAIGGLVMIFSGKLFRHSSKPTFSIDELTWKQALLIGLIQCLAMWPGTSRSMVTILAGMGVGLSLTAAAEFSFLLALPTLGGATLYKMMTDWDVLSASVGADSLAIGITVSALIAALSVKFLLHHLHRHGLQPFGVYRIALAIGVVAYFTWG